MLATRALRQAAAHAERVPSIKFLGPRSIPASIDHTPHPHPASPSGTLPSSFSSSSAPTSGHSSFSSYRDHAQQHGPLQRTIRSGDSIGSSSGAALGAINPPKGIHFDISELPARFRRAPIELAEIEAVESGGAALLS